VLDSALVRSLLWVILHSTRTVGARGWIEEIMRALDQNFRSTGSIQLVYSCRSLVLFSHGNRAKNYGFFAWLLVDNSILYPSS
jgi:hypothetical protein